MCPDPGAGSEGLRHACTVRCPHTHPPRSPTDAPQKTCGQRHDESVRYKMLSRMHYNYVDKLVRKMCIYCECSAFLYTRKFAITLVLTCVPVVPGQSYQRTRKCRDRFPSLTNACGRRDGMQDQFPEIRGKVGFGRPVPPSWRRRRLIPREGDGTVPIPARNRDCGRFARAARCCTEGSASTLSPAFSWVSGLPKDRATRTRPAEGRARIQAGRNGACLRDERHRHRAGATLPRVEATPPRGCRKEQCRASTGETRTTPARRGGNPAWRRAETLPRQGSGTLLGRYVASPQVNARKGPAVQPLVASLPGDAMEGFERVGGSSAAFKCRKLPGFRGVRCPSRGRMRLVLGPGAPDALSLIQRLSTRQLNFGVIAQITP
jgi:hypothetical protein